MEKNHTKPVLSSPFQSIDTWIFDLDNTLYPASSRLFDQVDRRITEYIMQALDLEWDDAHKKQKLFFGVKNTSQLVNRFKDSKTGLPKGHKLIDNILSFIKW